MQQLAIDDEIQGVIVTPKVLEFVRGIQSSKLELTSYEENGSDAADELIMRLRDAEWEETYFRVGLTELLDSFLKSNDDRDQDITPYDAEYEAKRPGSHAADLGHWKAYLLGRRLREAISAWRENEAKLTYDEAVALLSSSDGMPRL
ncbi:hypothetical protein BHAOGJBA_1710 [Methylobacterium hispanicum]|uniref:Uncharacterized protein n=1 Tax=Methylobacterium hispanicum TaxID=270350 RepID=A0AAV4ZJ32_9HYPH|nr:MULTISPECIES: hypothetical protein [Methylobacterium]GJD88197.1 hypothetical protein BHAOGJBA_1710 [Methylobacterium hispanicum]